jgi:hypothetical protein
MSERFRQHSAAWVNFSYAAFAIAVTATAIGIFTLPIDIWGRGYLLMGMIMVVQTAITVTKTLRDNVEGDRLIHRLEDARTEKLLLDAGRGTEDL